MVEGLTEPIGERGTYALATWLFLRLLGLIYCVAFVSLALQIKGLVGNGGILPARELLFSRRHWGPPRFWRLPTLCWINCTDNTLLALSWGGALLALLLVLGITPLPILVLLWIFYLSLFTVCSIFLGYQWDILLLETGFLAIFLAPIQMTPHFPTVAPSRIVIWLFWWLLFRLMFSSGIVKLRSGESTWRKLTALRYHYETQPLPTRVAWHAHQLPLLFHKASTVILFGIELVAPFFIVLPPPWRYVAGALFVLLMVLIQLTGNYCFFNLLGIALSVLLLDDHLLAPAWHWIWPGELSRIAAAPAWSNALGGIVAAVILILSPTPLRRLFRVDAMWPAPLESILGFLEGFRIVNSYGLFSVMTTERPELIIEGSQDGKDWKAYEFKWKPGRPDRAPRSVAPHQPRLDWQMWFAALGFYENNRWVGSFLKRLVEGSPEVLALLQRNPFDAPPRYVRAVLYDYRFTNRAEKRATGEWWKRQRRGDYSPTTEKAENEKWEAET